MPRLLRFLPAPTPLVLAGAVAAMAFLCESRPGLGQSIAQSLYVTNGGVYAAALSGNTLYIGGSFNLVGPATGSGVPIDEASGTPLGSFPRVTGIVHAVVPDGAGGWYIGGNFTAVGGIPRSNIAHILSDNTLSAWDPIANGSVLALAVSGTTVYAGGQFTGIGGQARSRIAALDAATGNATAWNPSAAGGGGSSLLVRTLAVSGTTIYAGGYFTSIGRQIRNHIAALDSATGSATAWDPNASGPYPYVHVLTVSGTTVYVGGGFTTIGGQSRNYVAALDMATGSATVWNPGANNYVTSLAVSGTTVYAGGYFASIGGQARNHVAALDAATGNATAWDPSAAGGTYPYVTSLAVSGTTVYAGGFFTSIGGQARNRLAALDATSGSATAWDPNVNGNVLALALSGTTVWAGGQFTSIGGQARNNIAALNLVTGSVTAWDPNANQVVRTLAVSGTTVYAGGEFTSIGRQARNHVAALDAATGNATAWDPNADYNVFTLKVDGATVYAGGNFSSIGGQPRIGVAALDAATGSATAWDANANNTVYALVLDGPTVYAGGMFTSIGGQSRNRMAALDAATGSATAWDPNANAVVFTLALGGTTVYAGGNFTSIGEQARNCIAAVDVITGSATAWDPNAQTTVYALVADGPTVYAGGMFSSIGGQARICIAALDAATGSATTWDPNPDGYVRALAVSGTTVYAGGEFTRMGNLPHSAIAGITDATVGVPSSPILEPIAVLEQSWPNPSRASSVIRFSLVADEVVTLKVYDLLGREVATPLANEPRRPGLHQVIFDTRRLRSGVYLYRLQAGRFVDTKKMAVLR